MPTDRIKHVARLAAVATDADERRYEAARWRHVAGGVLGSITVGAVFAYPLLAAPLGTVFRLTPSQASWVGTCGWMASLFTLPSGPLFDRFGPRVTNMIIFSVLVLCFVLMGLWFHLAGEAGVPERGVGEAESWRVVVVALTFSLMAWMVSFVDLPLMFSPMSVFPATKQDVIITTKPWMGLGGSVFATWYMGFFGAKTGAQDMAKYYWFVAGVMALCGVLAVLSITHQVGATADDAHDAAVLLRSAGGEDGAGAESDEEAAAAAAAEAASDEEKKVAHWTARLPSKAMTFTGFGMLVASVVVMSTIAAVENISRASVKKGEELRIPRGVSVLFGVVAILCLAQYWVLPVLASKAPWSPVAPKGSAVGLLADGEMLRPRGEKIRTDCLLASVKRPYFWTLFVTLASAWGVQAVLTSTFAMMYFSTLKGSCNDLDAGLNATFVVVFSVCSSMGRAFCGALERVLPRMAPTAYLPLPHILMSISLVLVSVLIGADASAPALALASIFHGFGEGAAWATAGLSVSNLFGPTSIGRHYAVFALGGVIAVPIMLQGIVAPMEEAARGEMAVGDWCCRGWACYGRSSLVVAALALVGAGFGVVTHLLWLRAEAAAEAEAAEPTKELQE